jgi:hypothetical protein
LARSPTTAPTACDSSCRLDISYTVPSTGLQTVSIKAKRSVSNINFGVVATTTGAINTIATEFDPIPADAGGEITSAQLIEVAQNASPRI